MIGRKLSHYEVVDEISRGGMGVVYRAVDLNLGREVALKVLPEDLVHDAERRERLLQEARAASALEHPNIAVIHEVGDAGGLTFIAMELIRGEKMSDTLSRGPLPQARAFALATEIAEALARAHEKGVIHRDLKPANVIVTDDGHAKVIDFGLAKLQPRGSAEAATASVRAPETGAGIVLGTAAYMSPEQARGGRVDHRTDIFSLGVTLYEMIAGRPAFHGRSALDTMQAVLTQPVPPLPALAGSSIEATAELQRIIDKSTAKEPEDRYQGMKDLIVDLRAARRRLESSPGLSTGVAHAPAAADVSRRPAGRKLIGILTTAALAVAVLGAGTYWWMARRATPAVSGSGKPTMAVLYFENNTGDASLDWMRTGLTDMLVTDLSQSTEFEVLGTDRLVQILQELRRADDRVISADLVQEIAKRAAVDNVLVGSYVRAGGTIRISARLQEAQTGRIVKAERVEGPGESSLFALVDELTRRFKTEMVRRGSGNATSLLVRPGEQPSASNLDRDLTDVTSSSIEAYRYYAEGMQFHERGQYAQASPMFEKAIAIDPDFAMAHAKLAVVNGNMGLLDKRDEHAKLAMALTNRLTSRERYYIEGYFYSIRIETRRRGIDAYKQGLQLHPEHLPSRHNLALQYANMERYAEGIRESEELMRRGSTLPITSENLVGMLIEVGELRRAREVADAYLREHPDSSTALRAHGTVLVTEGRLDEARTQFERAAALNQFEFLSKLGVRGVALMQERWTDAQAVNKDLAQASNVFYRMLSMFGESLLAAAAGKGRRGLELIDSVTRLDQLPLLTRTLARNRAAMILLRQRRAAEALTQAELALQESRTLDTGFETLQLLAIAQAAVGRKAESSQTLTLLQSRATELAPERELRRVHWARGEIALLAGDAHTAAEELLKAVKMLPQNGPVIGPPSSHLDLMYSAAVALVKAGRDADAARLLERIQAGHERAYATEAWARSFYLLAQIRERQGDTARAREQYARFVDLWRDGDLERGWVADAQKKMSP